MDDIKHCRECDVVLVVGENWYESLAKSGRQLCITCSAKRCKKWREKNGDYDKQRKKDWSDLNRARALHTLNPKPKCEWCGLARIHSLTFDHINDDGAEHRKELRSAATLAPWVIENPDEARERIQILCWDCNSRKQWYGLTKEKRLAEMEQEQCNPQQEQTENSLS